MGRISLEDKAAIICLLDADPSLNAAAMSRQLGLHRSTVSQAMGRLRKAGGWHTSIEYETCTQCGKGIVIPAGAKRTTHRGCSRSRVDPLARARWEESPEEKKEKKRSWWRERNNRKYEEMPEDRKRESLARLRIHTSTRQETSASLATKRREPWTDEERQYLIEHSGQSPMDSALTLGRTLYSVKARIHVMRRNGWLPLVGKL